MATVILIGGSLFCLLTGHGISGYLNNYLAFTVLYAYLMMISRKYFPNRRRLKWLVYSALILSGICFVVQLVLLLLSFGLGSGLIHSRSFYYLEVDQRRYNIWYTLAVGIFSRGADMMLIVRTPRYFPFIEKTICGQRRTYLEESLAEGGSADLIIQSAVRQCLNRLQQE